MLEKVCETQVGIKPTLLFGDFDTVAYKVQLDDNYLAL